MRRSLPAAGVVRGLLAVVAIAQAELGVWGIAAPRSLFDDYPGFGRHWIRALGAYNEHLIRDFAASELGFAVLLACMAIRFERRLVLIGGATFIAATLPHFAYHLTTTDAFSTADNTASLAGFALELAVVAVAMALAVKPQARGVPDAPSATRGAPRPRSVPPSHV